MFAEYWRRLTRAFRRVPANWEFRDGDRTDDPYVHGTSVLAMAFSPDDSILAIAGGGMIPRADPTIRLIDPVTRKNVRTLVGHVHGIHDLSFSRSTGLLASASYDYGVYLWDLSQEDVIFLMGEDYKTKGYSRFASRGSVLAIGEYECYEGPHSFHAYDLAKRRMSFRHPLPDGQGVVALAVSPDERHVAFASGNQNDKYPSRLFVFDVDESRLVEERVVEEYSFYDMTYVGRENLILAGVSGGDFDDFESGLILVDAATGAIRWKELLGGIGVTLARHPSANLVAVGFDSTRLRFYDTSDWSIVRTHDLEERVESERVCGMAFTNKGGRLAYGTSAGTVEIIELGDISTSDDDRLRG